MPNEIGEGEIRNTYNRLHRQYEGSRKEDFFTFLFLQRKFNLSEKEAGERTAWGGNDYGIDAYYFEEAKKNLYLFQFKWSDKASLFGDSFERLLTSGIERLFGDPTQDATANQLIARLKSTIIENRSIIDQVLVRFVFNGDKEKAEQSKTLTDYIDQLLMKKHLLDKYFGKEVNLSFDFDSNMGIGTPREKRETHRYEVKTEKFLKMSSGSNELFLTPLPSKLLLQMYNDMGEHFFDRNIRSGLAPNTDTNTEITRTLRRMLSGEELPDRFFLYHNGVSLTAAAVETDENSQVLHLVEPRILNGAQTVMCLKGFADENKLDDRVPQTLNNIEVLARIIRSPDDEFLKQVTYNNNRQNPIHPWNLHAGDTIQLKFEDALRDELGIFYERREGAFKQLTDSMKEDYRISETKPIQMTKFAQTILATQGEIPRMSNMPLVFGNKSVYDNTFRESYLRSLKELVMFYKIQYRLRSCIISITEKGEEKYTYVWNVKNLLWALLVQGLFNEDEFPAIVDKFGTNLVADAEFTLKLKDLASTRIRFIIGETFSKEPYVTNITEEKYSFLRTKPAFEDCIATAKRKYGWAKHSL